MYKDNRNSIAQREIDNSYQKTEFYNINQGLIAIDWNQLYQKHECINRILFFSKDRKSLKEIYDKLAKNKIIGMLLEKKNNGYYSLLVSKKYSKAIGVLKMVHYLNVPISHTVAFGDAANDYEMLSIVDRGIAMKNASMDLDVKEMTEYTNQEDGVARHLQKMLEQGEL